MESGSKRVWKSGCISLPGSFSLCFLSSAPMPFHAMRWKWQQMLQQGWDHSAQCSERTLSIYRNLHGLTDVIPQVFTTHWVYCWRHEVIYWEYFLLISFFFCHRKLPWCCQSCLTEITPFLLKGLICAWKQGLSAKVFVMTVMKSVNEWKNIEDTCLWLLVWVYWLLWVSVWPNEVQAAEVLKLSATYP